MTLELPVSSRLIDKFNNNQFQAAAALKEMSHLG